MKKHVILMLFVVFMLAANLNIRWISSSDIVLTPINSVIMVSSNGIFNLCFKMTFNEEEEGFFSVTFYWDNNESDVNCIYWNFTFISFVAQFVDGESFSSLLNVSIKKATPSGLSNDYYRYTLSIGELYGETKNGEFWVNATMLAAGLRNGTYIPHAVGIQNITIVNARCYESSLIESGSGNCSVEVTPQIGFHDVAVSSVLPWKTVLGQDLSMKINVTVVNEGEFIETFNVTLYANVTDIITQTVNSLRSNASTILTFTWNASSFAKGNYTIRAYAWPVLGETDAVDNTLLDGWIIIAITGDITGESDWPDGKVDIRDVALVASKFGVIFPDPKYDANCDLTGSMLGIADGKINIRDVALIASHFGEIDP